MANAILGDVWVAEFWTRQSNRYALNVKAFRVTGQVGVVGVPDTLLVSEFITKFAAVYRACMPSNAEFYGVQMYRTHPSPSTGVYQVSIAAGVLGTTCSPGQVCGFVRLRNAGLGRRNKSRIYVPFVPQAVVNLDGNPTSLYVIRLNNIGSEFVTPATVIDGAQEVTLTLCTNTFPADDGRLLTSFSVANRFATMRSRSNLDGSDTAPF